MKRNLLLISIVLKKNTIMKNKNMDVCYTTLNINKRESK